MRIAERPTETATKTPNYSSKYGGCGDVTGTWGSFILGNGLSLIHLAHRQTDFRYRRPGVRILPSAQHPRPSPEWNLRARPFSVSPSCSSSEVAGVAGISWAQTTASRVWEGLKEKNSNWRTSTQRPDTVSFLRRVPRVSEAAYSGCTQSPVFASKGGVERTLFHEEMIHRERRVQSR